MENEIVILVDTNNKLKGIKQDFKEWIEQTQLFLAIKQHAGTGLIIESLPYGLQIQLNGISKVEKAEDLPIEFIQNFYENSPFYTDNTYTQKQINLNNESTSEENLW